MPKTSRECVVVLPDESQFTIPVQPSLLASDLLNIAASHCKVKEKSYFGLMTEMEGYRNWLEMDKAVLDPIQDLPKGSDPIKLYFSFKYYIDTYQDLQDHVTVEMLYLQARKSIEKSEIITDEQTVYELAALVMQANHGSFTSDEEALKILQATPIIPAYIFQRQSVKACEEHILRYYGLFNQLSRGEAIFRYLEIVQSLPMYSYHYFKVKDKGNIPLWLGVGSNGIVQCLHDNKNDPVAHYQWMNIQNIYYKDKKFSVEVYTSSRSPRKSYQSTLLAWYGKNPKVVVAIWKMVRDQHVFYRSRRTSKSTEFSAADLDDSKPGMTMTEILRHLSHKHRHGGSISPSSSHSSLSIESAKSSQATGHATNFEIIDQNNLEEAMKEGSVESHITKAVVQGEARAGKTSFKCLLLHLPYDELSTSCVEAPQIAFRKHSFSVSRFGRTNDGKHWKPVNEEEMFDMILAELRSITEKKTIESTFIPTKSTTVVHDSPEPTTELTPMPIPESTPELTSDPIPFQSESPVETEVVHSFTPEVNELFEKCKNIHKKEGLSIHHDWLYFIDSGGQIQFQKLLPVFMPFASHLILVLNLAKSLSCPSSTVMQLCDRQIEVGKHSLTVEEILKQLVSAIALSTEKFNTLITQDHILSKYIHLEVDKLNVIAVATHGDECSTVRKNEQLKRKEEMLNKLCSSMKQKCKLVRGDTPQSHCDILYDVDGSKAKSGKFDDPVVEQIAEKLQSQAYKIDVPIKWYCFCVLLHKIAKEGCGVLSLSDCQALGKELQIPKDEVASALKFFHILNMLLYYPDSPAVADMVFVQVNSLIDIIRDLVVLACSDDRRAEADVEKLATQGFLSVTVLEMLEKYRKISSAFKTFGDKLLSLFEHLLIAVHLPDDKHTYFMPALLPVSEVKDIDPEEPPPLLFYFENAVPMGLFCTTIVHLSKVFLWHVIGTENYSNYITLQNDNSLKEIVLVERIDCIEVRAKHPDALIARHIEESIRGHGKSYEKAFYCSFPDCEYHGTRHIAVMDRLGDKDVRVRCNSSKRRYNLDEGMSCWFKETVSTGSSAVPHTPHNSKSIAAEQEYIAEIAYDILRSNTSRIKKSMIGLSYLADKLAEKEIISEDEKRQVTRDMKSGLNEDERMDQLLDALKATVEVDGSYFGWFIEILRDKGTVLTKKLADHLLIEYTKIASKTDQVHLL